MAGSPKKRARREGKPPPPPPDGSVPSQPPDDDKSWAEDLARQLMGEPPMPGVAPVPGAPPTPGEALIRLQRADREVLTQWWRDQIEHIERTAFERAQMLATAGAHPNVVFAQQAKMFGALGIPRDVAARLLMISEGELEGHYGAEYAVGSAEVVSMVSANLIRIATSQNDRVAVKAAIEVMNRRGGEEWRAPAQKIEVKDDRRRGEGLIDSTKLTYEQRQTLRAIMIAARGAGETIDAVPAAGLIAGRPQENDGE